MPIIAIEGPDKCGKSTLFNKLLDKIPADFVQVPSFGKARMHIARELALRDLELWEALYDPNKLYVCDRHVVVCDDVYSQLYNRPKLRESWLTRHIGVLYLDTPVQTLALRHVACNEDVQKREDYGLVQRLYIQTIQKFPHRVLSPAFSIEEAITGVKELADDLV